MIHLPETCTDTEVSLLLNSTKVKSWAPAFPSLHSCHLWYLHRWHGCHRAHVHLHPDTGKGGFACKSPSMGTFTPRAAVRLLLLSAAHIPSYRYLPHQGVLPNLFSHLFFCVHLQLLWHEIFKGRKSSLSVFCWTKCQNGLIRVFFFFTYRTVVLKVRFRQV